MRRCSRFLPDIPTSPLSFRVAWLRQEVEPGDQPAGEDLEYREAEGVGEEHQTRPSLENKLGTIRTLPLQYAWAVVQHVLYFPGLRAGGSCWTT